MKNSEQVAFYRKVSVLVKFTLNSLYVFSLVNGFRSISDIWIVLYQKKNNHKQINNTAELYSIKGDERINKYTPAVTIVAACIKADTGVGNNVDFHYVL
nr:NADH dehydrogenase subunit 5 [Fusarium oxysporum]